jgi:2-dehydro-3-deoxy-D-arabinonate dehydratase
MQYYLSRHETPDGPRWARDGRYLPRSFSLSAWLDLPLSTATEVLGLLPTSDDAAGPLLPPIEPQQEAWACGVTYLRSRDARMAETTVVDIYERVYLAERPEIFFKAAGWRVAGHEQPIRVRRDSTWDVPEPELVLVVNRQLEIVGYTAGNDVSSRSIEGENPLYLPQAKMYDGSCSLGPGIVVTGADVAADVPIRLQVARGGGVVFEGESSTAMMKRSLVELVACLGAEMAFPYGAFLMTGTSIVPPESFTLTPGDRVDISVGDLILSNTVTV